VNFQDVSWVNLLIPCLVSATAFLKPWIMHVLHRKALGASDQAEEDYHLVLKLQPSNKEAAQALQELEPSR
jgi:hypothetical protein